MVESVFRRKATELAAKQPLELPSNEEELKALVQELQVHQIELELQQQELMYARASAEYSRDRYEDLYDLAPVGYLSLDESDRIIQANLTATTLMSIDRADLINERFPRLIHPDDQDAWYYCQQAARNGQDDRPADLRVHTDDSSYRWMRVAVRADVGRAESQPRQGNGRLLLTLSDITERKADEQTLRTLNEQLQARTAELDARNAELHAIMDHLTQGVTVADLQGRVYQWNRAALEIHGFANVEDAQKQLEEFTGIFELSTLTGEILPLEEWPLARVLRGETLRDLQLRVRHLKEGWERIWLYAGALVQGQEGVPFCAVVGITDITEREQAMEALRHERELLQTIYDAIPVMLTVYHPQIEDMTLSKEVERVTGWTDEDTARTHIMELAYPDPAYRQEIAEYMHSLEPGFKDIDIITKTGDIVHTSWANVRIPDGRMVGIGINITERRRAEELLRENERLLAQRLNNLEALYDVSQALLGRQHNENVLRLICEATVRRFGFCMAWIGLLQEDGQVLPAAVYGHDQGHMATSLGLDSTCPVRLHVRSPVIEAIRGDQGQSVVDLQQAEEMVEPYRREAIECGVRSRVILPIRVEGESLGALVVYGGAPADTVAEEQLDSLQSLANLAALALQRAKLVERITNHAQSLEQTVALRTEELARSEAHLRAIFDGAAIGIGVVDSEGRILSANHALEELLGCPAKELIGQKVTAYVSEDDAQAQTPRFEDLVAGRERLVRLDFQYRRGDGVLGWANVVVSRLSNEASERDRFVVMIEDTTEQRRTLAALLQSEKLAATGRLVAGLAHEINNPLQAVIGCLGLAQEVLAEGENAENFLTIATEELNRAAKLVHDLYEIYRPGDERREAVDLNALVHRVVDLTRRQYERGQIEVGVYLAEELPMVTAVPDRIQQVMLNLVLNAVDAMPEGGQLEIRSSTSPDPESGRSGVRVEFRDHGKGVSADVLEHLFEPFTTTKEDGSGLGLFVCRTILEQHGGSIRLESREGEGTAAIVWLPC